MPTVCVTHNGRIACHLGPDPAPRPRAFALRSVSWTHCVACVVAGVIPSADRGRSFSPLPCEIGTFRGTFREHAFGCWMSGRSFGGTFRDTGTAGVWSFERSCRTDNTRLARWPSTRIISLTSSITTRTPPRRHAPDCTESSRPPNLHTQSMRIRLRRRRAPRAARHTALRRRHRVRLRRRRAGLRRGRHLRVRHRLRRHRSRRRSRHRLRTAVPAC